MKTENQYINCDGYWLKIFPENKYGEILNTHCEAIVAGSNDKDIKDTFFDGIDKFIDKYGAPETYDAISVQNLIAELSLSMINPSMPCYLKDGTPVTGVYVEDGLIRIDTDNQRAKEIKQILKETL